jgi:4-hydroxy-tetrahydrodipicolinate synthase
MNYQASPTLPSPLSGVITAIITPMKQDGSVDFAGLKQNVTAQIEAGVQGIIALGTTGETPTLTADEQIEIIESTRALTKGKILLGVGTGTNATNSTIERTKQAQEMGADFVLITAPFYNKPTQQGIFAHFSAITSACSLPIMVYNVPGRSGVNITADTLGKLTALTTINAIKESSGNLDQALDMLHVVNDMNIHGIANFSVLSGDDSFTLSLMAAGATGVVSVASNVAPEEMVALVAACSKGDFETARALQYKLLPLMRALFVESNPQPIKAAMNMAGYAGGSCRLPLLEALPTTKALLAEALRVLEIEVKS